MKINRVNILENLVTALKKDKSVFAVWLEGADAAATVDKYSDVDLWLDVRDGHELKMFRKIKKTLAAISKIDFCYEQPHPHPKIRQFFLHLEKTSRYLLIDVCIQCHSRKLLFSKNIPEETPKVLFDKDKVIRFKKSYSPEETKNSKELLSAFVFLQTYVAKEIKRRNFLEALNNYHKYVIGPLTTCLRLRYCPEKKDYHLKHIYRDLPKNVTKKLEKLCKISSLNQIESKTKEATQFLRNVLEKK
jgi:hypothetical protein